MKKTDSPDFEKYDTLSLVLKKEELVRMLGFYESFGWREYERLEDSKYFDIAHVRLFREHKIPNKDRLQLLQVKMETKINAFASARRKKHSKSVSIAVAFAVFGLLVFLFGMRLAFEAEKLFVFGISLSAVGLVIPLALIPAVKKCAEKENKRFASCFKTLAADMSRILSAAEKLYGGDELGSEKI